MSHYISHIRLQVHSIPTHIKVTSALLVKLLWCLRLAMFESLADYIMIVGSFRMSKSPAATPGKLRLLELNS